GLPAAAPLARPPAEDADDVPAVLASGGSGGGDAVPLPPDGPRTSPDRPGDADLPAAGEAAGGPPVAQPGRAAWVGGNRSGGASLAEPVPADAPHALARAVTPAAAPVLPWSGDPAAPGVALSGSAPAPFCSPALAAPSILAAPAATPAVPAVP